MLQVKLVGRRRRMSWHVNRLMGTAGVIARFIILRYLGDSREGDVGMSLNALVKPRHYIIKQLLSDTRVPSNQQQALDINKKTAGSVGVGMVASIINAWRQAVSPAYGREIELHGRPRANCLSSSCYSI